MSEIDLTEDQKKVLSEVYSYSDDFEITEEDLQLASEMFDDPKKFKLLRKMLAVHTPDEKGISFADPQSLVDAHVSDFQRYAIETAVNHLASEKVRRSLVEFYVKLRRYKQAVKKDEFDAQNAEQFAEEKRTEEYEEAQEEDKRIIGSNL